MHCSTFSVSRGLGFKIWSVCVPHVLRCVDRSNHSAGCDFADSDRSAFFDDGLLFKSKTGMWLSTQESPYNLLALVVMKCMHL